MFPLLLANPENQELAGNPILWETIFRARNNFRIVSGHDDRPNSFLLGHVSFLAGQMCMMMSVSMCEYCKQWL